MDYERIRLRNSVIERIIAKETLHAIVAKYCLEQKQEEQFLIDCYDQLHAGAFQRFLGEELFNDLVKYNVEYNNKQ